MLPGGGRADRGEYSGAGPRAAQVGSASRPATVDSMPGGRFPGSWSITCYRPCHGVQGAMRWGRPAPRMSRRAWCSLLWTSHSESRRRYLSVSISAHQPREGPLPDLLTGDRVRGLQLTAGALPSRLRHSGVRFLVVGWGGAGEPSWLTITGCGQFRLADLLV